MMMKHLMWKDAMAIRPLVVAILVGILVAFLMLGLASVWVDAMTATTWFASFWILMPNLVALGAPAVLVGTEEESGTLSWIRTLPVAWSKVADSKFVVAVVAVLITWGVSSLAMALARITFATNPSPMVQEWTSVAGVVYLLVFSLSLLCCGFLTSYCFRSPVAALLAVVPLITLLNVLIIQGAQAFLGQHSYEPEMRSIATQELLILIGGAIVMLIGGYGIQRMLAKRRLTSPDGTGLVKTLVSDNPVSAYRPPLSMSTSRPPMWKALLWQQHRQMAWFGLGLTLIGGVFLLSNGRGMSQDGGLRFLRNFSPPVVLICASWLGALAFYGDNVRRRFAFFADRGISATSVWWTRVLLPSLLCLVLVTIAIVMDLSRRDLPSWIALVALTFGFGVLVGQWVKRPVMAFFAGPVFATVVSAFLISLAQYYPDYRFFVYAAVPVAMFASWRLTSRWLTDRVDFGYHWRVIAYSAVAVAIPIGLVVAARISSTPELDVAWRTRIAASARELSANSPSSDLESGDLELHLAPHAFSPIGTGSAFDDASAEERLEMLDEELRNSTVGIDGVRFIGSSLTLPELREMLAQSSYSSSSETALKSIDVLLSWARAIRKDVIDGELGFSDLEFGAELSEQLAVSQLASIVGGKASPEITALIQKIPDAETRRQSRRASLIREWEQYQQQSWRGPDGLPQSKSFMGINVAIAAPSVDFERTRGDRFVDEMTKLLLQQLDLGLPENDSEGMRERDRIFKELLGPGVHYRTGWGVCRGWRKSYEESIVYLQRRAR